VLTVPTDAQALKLGYRYVVYGPDLKIAYAATTFTSRRKIPRGGLAATKGLEYLPPSMS